MDKYCLYDNIVKATYMNLAIEAIHNNGIYFNSFNEDDYMDKFFLKVAFMAADFEHQLIYINCKFFDFLKILFHNYSIKKILSGKCCLRFRRRESSPSTNIKELAAFEAREFEVNPQIFEEIWKEYYEVSNLY